MPRPTKYKKQYCKQIIEFFSRPPYEEVEVKHYYKDGGFKIETKRKPNDLPFLSQFAREIGVCGRTLERWAKKHKEFCRAYKEAKELQKAFLIKNGLLGLYKASFAIFTAKNITDMRDEKYLPVERENVEGKYGVIVLPEILDLKEGDNVLEFMEGKGNNNSPNEKMGGINDKIQRTAD